MRSSAALVAVLGLALASPLTTGCAYEEAPDEASLEIPLVQPGGDGALYRLRASFEIVRPGGASFVVEGDPDAQALTLTLDPGLHEVRLIDGWGLERSFDSGVNYAPVNAILAGANPTFIRVVPNRAVSTGFYFFVREATGNLSISFGVDPSPRQLSMGVTFRPGGTGVYADYAGGRVDLQLYFAPAEQTVQTDAEGARSRTYYAWESALEIYNDTTGRLAALAPGFAGGSVEHTISVKADGTHEFSGRFDSFVGTSLVLGASTNAQLAVGEDGFPADEFFYASGSTVELITDDGTITGRLTSLRHFQ